MTDFDESSQLFKEQQLKELLEEQLKEELEAWFRQNYEDPVVRTPYESKEGGYIWIWGGPYDAKELLENEFGYVASEDVINDVVDILEEESIQWVPTESPGDYDDYFINDIASITDVYCNFSSSINDIRKLLNMNIKEDISGRFYQLLYVNVITAMETYLSDAFISRVIPNEDLFKIFVKTTPEFKQQKFVLSEIYTEFEKLETNVKTNLHDVIWHNLGKIKPMYRDTLKISFPDDLKPVIKAIMNRHDLVHRNGKNKDGKELSIEFVDVESLIESVEEFVEYVDKQLADSEENDITSLE